MKKSIEFKRIGFPSEIYRLEAINEIVEERLIYLRRELRIHYKIKENNNQGINFLKKYYQFI